MIGPCLDHIMVAHAILAVFNGLSLVLSCWLAHRRKVADIERRAFYEAVSNKLELDHFTHGFGGRFPKRGNGQ